MWGLSERETRLLALYGVRVSRIGAFLVPFGIRMTVFSFTPSRIGIISSRLTKSNASLWVSNLSGVSLGSAVADGFWGSADAAPAVARQRAKRWERKAVIPGISSLRDRAAVERTRGFLNARVSAYSRISAG
jgi:hypothetical protein